jgi:hypothetical protein
VWGKAREANLDLQFTGSKLKNLNEICASEAFFKDLIIFISGSLWGVNIMI